MKEAGFFVFLFVFLFCGWERSETNWSILQQEGNQTKAPTYKHNAEVTRESKMSFFAFKLFTFELEILFLKGPHGCCELMTTMP